MSALASMSLNPLTCKINTHTCTKTQQYECPPTKDKLKNNMEGNSLAVQWLRLYTSTTAGMGDSIPGWGTKI